ncbi:Translin [Rhodotorula diobovata]|uniref:Translin n=1 Tax=Rhodotorula diobovata TaxID=5288 RepID=A0A5C5G5Y3_9BASI|nr:Translin [Rhodotorula diobovata]
MPIQAETTPTDAPAAAGVAPTTSSTETGPDAVKPSRADTLLAAFTSFRAELDAHHAQRERIVKLSRDVTALSKQLIFTLHRVGSGKGKRAVFDEAEAKMDGLRRLFDKLQGEVRGADFWRYERSVSPGIQEYLEGFTFYHYLEHHTLPTLEQAQASLFPPAAPAPAPASTAPPASTDPSSPSSPAAEPAPAAAASGREPYFRVTVDDYLGGVADLTGELMRLAIASVGKNLSDSLAGPATECEGEDKGFADIDRIGTLVREIQGEMTPLAAYARWLPKKLQVLDQSLAKIENASYNLRIRGAEYKDSPAMLQALARREADSGGAGAGAGGRDEVAA